MKYLSGIRRGRLMLLTAALLAALALLCSGFACAEAAELTAEASTVEEMVEKLAAECTASGAQTDYEIALWMHNWLMYNSEYDYTLTVHGPEGVLLNGTGVCESYARAYCLLMDRMGIESQMVTSPEMDHAWNVICIDGVWCHVDCTWDETGGENHCYFGLNDTLMSRDHTWDTSAYPACTSTEYYYPLISDVHRASDAESMEALLNELAEAQTEEFEIYYTGTDGDFDIKPFFTEWFNANNWRYGLLSYGYRAGDYYISATIDYTQPWDQPENKLENPVAAPSFALNSPDGCYRLSNYSRNGVLLVIGSRYCSNTRALTGALEQEAEALAAAGVEILVSLVDAPLPEDLAEICAEFPGVNLVCGSGNLMWDYLAAVNYSADTAYYPAAFIINSDGMITYYSTGYVSNTAGLLSEAYAVSTGNALPLPEENDYSQGVASTGSINGISGAETLRTLAADSSLLLYVTDAAMYSDSTALFAEYEENIELYDRLGIRIAASYLDNTDASATYPGVAFFDYDSGLFWSILRAAGFEAYTAAYKSAFLIEPDGDIVSYVNGDLLSPRKAAINLLKGFDYAVRTPEALKSIEAGAFENAAFDSVDLTGSPVSAIGDRAFADCDGLELIRIPSRTQTIAATAFDGCDDVLIFCDAGSAAHRFAVDHGIACLPQ